ncbi:MAG: RlpA-like double-psi beta-barrel domain-containing protein [Myxococcaceae bacterium]|nr:RlpA-like double-psi beta-barrel domain-containing protein [Myxococcaceae bacterium]
MNARVAVGVMAVCWGACSAPAPPVSIGEKVDGVITFYDGDGRGACGYEPGDSLFAAINAEQWAASAACGTCLEITGPKGKTVVRTVDLCPECKRGHPGDWCQTSSVAETPI